ncbi:putative quinol monooxygenase [Sulfitobacter aestuariivivens]|uniref:Antibiotic biosynthesis monooxygenase n=1 Tax=Sulfitobacter aestuariivivens TaxID=2766981 RepID=A0A927D0E6_9RHOB|nr:antibiotic biosynthesis monooxygenase [Sulfitobacter aestuariivivens]MBD3662750.1 antibiotic biosynthesis monooxygenase [Sulfitobacter aestuariivivens]
MSDVIEWVLEMDVQDGQWDNVGPLLDDMVAATKADEPGAMHYEYYTDAEHTKVTVLERYADNAAAMIHLGNFGAKFAERFLAVFAPTRIVVYGPAEDDLRAGMAGFGAMHMDYLKGFAR